MYEIYFPGRAHVRVSVCVIGMVIGKTYFDVKANINCDICYFGIVARISELFQQSGLEDVLKEVPKGSGLEGVLEEVPEGAHVRDFRRQLQISRYEFI